MGVNMASKKNDTGFQSSAGLMRYFDTEDDKGLKVSPRTVIGLAIAAIVIVLLANTLAPI
jgi:preprotein translocase subunit Sec61beta